MSPRRVVAAILVRMGSQRLPGKVLGNLAGRPALDWLVRRVRLCPGIDDVVVGTSVRPENDIIEQFCAASGIACFRGPECDVAARLLGLLDAHRATVGVNVFGDEPLIDPAVIALLLERFGDGAEWDFVGNDLATTYPPGMDAEVFSVAAFRHAVEACDDPAVREHSTLCLRRRPDLFRLLNVEAPSHQRRPELELELDTEEDQVVVEAIFDHFAGHDDFSLDDIITFLDRNPDLRRHNATVVRRWKTFRIASIDNAAF